MSENEIVNVKQIFEANPTAKAIKTSLSGRQRYRRYINLTHYRQKLKRQGVNVDAKEYSDLWKKLEDAGVGSYIVGRRNNPNRFVWNYSLVDVAKAASGQDLKEFKQLSKAPGVSKEAKRRPGRPKGSTKVKTKASVDGITLNIKLSPNVSSGDISALLDIIRGLK